jgi:hypothetical protein
MPFFALSTRGSFSVPLHLGGVWFSSYWRQRLPIPTVRRPHVKLLKKKEKKGVQAVPCMQRVVAVAPTNLLASKKTISSAIFATQT